MRIQGGIISLPGMRSPVKRKGERYFGPGNPGIWEFGDFLENHQLPQWSCNQVEMRSRVVHFSTPIIGTFLKPLDN